MYACALRKLRKIDEPYCGPVRAVIASVKFPAQMNCRGTAAGTSPETTLYPPLVDVQRAQQQATNSNERKQTWRR